MAGSVQFRSSEAVLTAYENSSCPAWSLWQGGQLLFKFAGKTAEEAISALSNVLEMLGESSNAIYTLKVYEDIGGKEKIKNNTPYDGSFNFRLNADSQELNQSQYRNYSGMKELQTQIAALSARIEAREAESDDDDEEEDETERQLGKIGALLNNPVVQQLAGLLFRGTNLAPAPGPRAVGALGNVPPAPDQEQQISQALAILKDKDPKLGEHLTKLAQIAQSSPANFDYMLTLVEQITI
jgi:hypothetical protein